MSEVVGALRKENEPIADTGGTLASVAKSRSLTLARRFSRLGGRAIFLGWGRITHSFAAYEEGQYGNFHRASWRKTVYVSWVALYVLVLFSSRSPVRSIDS